jgi:hypothetical protein
MILDYQPILLPDGAHCMNGEVQFDDFVNDFVIDNGTRFSFTFITEGKVG